MAAVLFICILNVEYLALYVCQALERETSDWKNNEARKRMKERTEFEFWRGVSTPSPFAPVSNTTYIQDETTEQTGTIKGLKAVKIRMWVVSAFVLGCARLLVAP
jgi:hypothetical protein